MKTILVCGGNSGIGLQSVREFVAQGHRVVMLGRNQQKGEDAIASLGEAGNQARFFSVDLSTHAGVRAAAELVLAEYQHFDAILHTTGVLTLNKDIRTSDGLNLFFAVNYLSRYHLTQLFLPALRRANRGKVVMMTAHIRLSTKVDFDLFPIYKPFNFTRMREQIQIGNHHYAAHIAQTEPELLVGVVNAGAAKTDIMRLSPWYIRAISSVIVPLFYNSIEESAHNAVQACLRDDWHSATYWENPGDFNSQTLIDLDEIETMKIMEASRDLVAAPS